MLFGIDQLKMRGEVAFGNVRPHSLQRKVVKIAKLNFF